MSLGSRLKNEREKRRWSQIEVAKKIGITNAVLSNYERDYRDPDTETLKKLANLYEVSIDYLLGNTEQKHYYELHKKDKRDIAKELEKILSGMDSKENLNFAGEPMDETTRELVKAQIESNLKFAKQMAKKKFTPKKYRKGE